MSRVIVLALLVILLAGGAPTARTGAQEGTPAADCPATGEEEAVALARRFAEARYVTPAVLDDLLAPDVVYHRSVTADTMTAAEARQRAEAFRAAFPDVRVTVELVTAKEDIAVAVWTAEGTHLGALDGVAPTGRRATWEGISILRIGCGRVVELWNQTDALSLREQLGIVSAAELADAEPSDAATPTP